MYTNNELLIDSLYFMIAFVVLHSGRGRGGGGSSSSASNTRPQPSNSIGEACLGKTVDVPNNQKFVYQEPEEVSNFNTIVQ